MHEIDLAPSAAPMMESIRSIGYTPQTAVADLIDNSIAANASEIEILRYPNLLAIGVIDNGSGMNLQTLTEAMRYGTSGPGKERSSNDLGRFGLGLKTASLSICKKLTVVSKQGNTITGARWDLDKVRLYNSWKLSLLDNSADLDEVPYFEQLTKSQSGTLVAWENLDRLNLDPKNEDHHLSEIIQSISSHLALVFHRYIEGEVPGGRLTIRVNHRPISPRDPFLLRHNTAAMATETLRIGTEKILVTPYTLPHPDKLRKADFELLGEEASDLHSNQGFYTYRNKRLITWGNWYGLARKDQFNRLSRIQVDIPNSLDHLWSLDVKKSSASFPESIRKPLKTLVDTLTQKSKTRIVTKGKPAPKQVETPIWNRVENRNRQFSYEINVEHPLIQLLFEHLNVEDKRTLRILIHSIQATLPLRQIEVDFSQNILDETNEENEKLLRSQMLEFYKSSEAHKVDILHILNQSLPSERFFQYFQELGLENE